MLNANEINLLKKGETIVCSECDGSGIDGLDKGQCECCLGSGEINPDDLSRFIQVGVV